MRSRIEIALNILSHRIRRTSLAVICGVAVPVLILGALFPAFAGAAQPGPATAPTATSPSLTISPGVITVQTQPGQSATYDVTLSNLTPTELGFQLEAMDVDVRDGKRVFVPAGELPGSIARTAVFSPDSVLVEPGNFATVHVTVTVPDNPGARAIVAIFRSHTKMLGQNGLMFTASLGTLMTFTLSNKLQIETAAMQFDGTSQGDDLTISEWVTNTGTEPVIPSGVVAILNSTGKLVGKVPVEAMRLLPGERLQFKAAYPAALKPGKYRALMTLEHDGTVLTTSSDFEIQ
jgi:hypothetical protein